MSAMPICRTGMVKAICKGMAVLAALIGLLGVLAVISMPVRE